MPKVTQGRNLVDLDEPSDGLFEFCLKAFAKFSDKNIWPIKGFKPATSCVRDQNTTAAPARHRETESLN